MEIVDNVGLLVVVRVKMCCTTLDSSVVSGMNKRQMYAIRIYSPVVCMMGYRRMYAM